MPAALYPLLSTVAVCPRAKNPKSLQHIGEKGQRECPSARGINSDEKKRGGKTTHGRNEPDKWKIEKPRGKNTPCRLTIGPQNQKKRGDYQPPGYPKNKTGVFSLGRMSKVREKGMRGALWG